MKKFYFVLLALLAGVALASCSIDDDDDDGSTPSSIITGIFESSYSERFEITTTTFTNYYKDSNNDYKKAYEGTVSEIPQGSSAIGSGIIYIKYTRAMYDDGSYSYGEHASDVGKYYAIAYKDLTTGGVKISAAYKNGGKSSCDTLQEAKTEFTEANGYFSVWSECTRVKK